MPAIDAYQDYIKERDSRKQHANSESSKVRWHLVDGMTVRIDDAFQVDGTDGATCQDKGLEGVPAAGLVTNSAAPPLVVTASVLLDALSKGKIRQGVLDLEADSRYVPPEVPKTYEEALRLWQCVPRHIQILAFQMEGRLLSLGPTTDPTREHTIQRILDNEVSLDEAAQILRVCDATVRRLTKSGTLLHRRTVGKHRRFRVSDVVTVFESRLGKSGGREDV